MNELEPKPRLLLVEGSDDLNLVKHLTRRYGLQEVEQYLEDGGGFERMLLTLSVRLKESPREVLGIIVDADDSLSRRWQSVAGQLSKLGYEIPETPSVDGTIIDHPNLPRVGVWLMPDNSLPGTLEVFARMMIPEGDALEVEADSVLSRIESAGIARYKSVHRPKAFIHTWLAWQEPPGIPMGYAISKSALEHGTPVAACFIHWVKRLFILHES